MSKQDQHNRRSIRLSGYNYFSCGIYFVTICTFERKHLFGQIYNGEMWLSKFGNIVIDEWNLTASRRPYINLDNFVVMPNHFHGLIIIHEQTASQVKVLNDSTHSEISPKPHSLGAIIRGFKSSVTNKINSIRNTPQAPVWQRNYYEHIIRNEDDLNNHRQYIQLNPSKWWEDTEYTHS